VAEKSSVSAANKPSCPEVDDQIDLRGPSCAQLLQKSEPSLLAFLRAGLQCQHLFVSFQIHAETGIVPSLVKLKVLMERTTYACIISSLLPFCEVPLYTTFAMASLRPLHMAPDLDTPRSVRDINKISSLSQRISFGSKQRVSIILTVRENYRATKQVTSSV